MNQQATSSFTAFAEGARISSGSLLAVALAVKAAHDSGITQILVFADDDGRPVELDLRGAPYDVEARLTAVATPAPPAPRGRPKLGVTAREVTLLPGHWDWLSSQPGGASAALRRLVEEARRAGPNLAREASDAAYRVMSSLAGNAPQFEEATRAFFAKDYDRFESLSQAWPVDVGDYVRGLVRRAADLEAKT